MKLTNQIFLPGTEKQISLFLNSEIPENKSVLIIGSGSEEIAKIFRQNNAAEIFLIVEDEDSLVQSRFLLSDEKEIKIRMMDFTNTDFKPEKFDIIYAQGSTGVKKRKRIVKEIKKIIKPDGTFCVGEIVSLTENPPQFVKDIWENSNLTPLFAESIKDFYLSNGFEVTFEKDLSNTLKDFYSKSKELLSESSKDLSGGDLKHFQKIARTYKHEANAYLKLGGDKHIGFWMLVLKKNMN
ncbi:MAG TPA: methyltransferase domain-containing protein [Ignavibacteriaceae bacterium]|nr:methyltransferase domain-containing protein [Ignavibacteriaceae bacterium]